jgi:hypothetical protein
VATGMDGPPGGRLLRDLASLIGSRAVAKDCLSTSFLHFIVNQTILSPLPVSL